MIVKICTCAQCSGLKSKMPTKLKKRIKRYLNRLRRNWQTDDKVKNYLYS